MLRAVVIFLWLGVLSPVISMAMASLPFQTVGQGSSSAIEDALTEVYRTPHEFEAFWARHGSNSYPPPGAPHVDFSSKMVAAVFTGTKNSGGYSVEITSVNEDEGSDELVVNFETSAPAPGAMVTMALTQPYHIISLDASDKKVVFVGSAKPTAQIMPKFILTLTEYGKANRDAVVAQMEALPGVKEVRVLGSLSIIFVDFHSDGATTKEEARDYLQAIEGVNTIEEEY